MQLGATLCRVYREDHSAEMTSKLRPDMYTLLYLKWMTNKDLQYSRGNCAQCYVAVWMEGVLGEHGYVYTYGWVPLLVTWNDNNIISQLCCCESLSHDQLFVTPWAAACQAPLSFTISQGLPKFMSIELVMSSNHLILCHLLLLLPSISPSLRIFSNELAVCIRWPKYWSLAQSKLKC